MKAYSIELREHIVHCVDSGQGIAGVAERFEVCARTVRRYLRQHRETGDRSPKRHPGLRPKLTEEQVTLQRANLQRHPSLTLAERRDWGCGASTPTRPGGSAPMLASSGTSAPTARSSPP